MPVTAISLATGCLLRGFLGVGTVESVAGAVSSNAAFVADGLSGKTEASFSCECASGARRQTAPRMQSQTTGGPAKQGLFPKGTFTGSQSRFLGNRAPGQWNQTRKLPECTARSVGWPVYVQTRPERKVFPLFSPAQPDSPRIRSAHRPAPPTRSKSIFSSSTFTRGSPRNPSCRPSVRAFTSIRTASSERCRSRATRAT
jgi:hypothetical protein